MVPLCLMEPLYSADRVDFHILLWITNQFCQSGGKKNPVYCQPGYGFWLLCPHVLISRSSWFMEVEQRRQCGGNPKRVWGKGKGTGYSPVESTQSSWRKSRYLVLLLGTAFSSDTNFYVMEYSGLLLGLPHTALTSSAFLFRVSLGLPPSFAADMWVSLGQVNCHCWASDFSPVRWKRRSPPPWVRQS